MENQLGRVVYTSGENVTTGAIVIDGEVYERVFVPPPEAWEFDIDGAFFVYVGCEI